MVLAYQLWATTLTFHVSRFVLLIRRVPLLRVLLHGLV
jgi:hypothetical protein